MAALHNWSFPAGQSVTEAGLRHGPEVCSAVMFTRSIRSLRTDSYRGSMFGLLAVMLLLGGWGAWFFLGSVTVYEASATARLETEHTICQVQSPVSGRVLVADVPIGREVRAGDVLIELDAASLQYQLDEASARAAAISEQIALLRAEAKTHEQALEQLRQTAPLRLDEARARVREAEAAARFAREQLEQIEALIRSGNATELERRRALADAQQRDAAVEALRLAADRVMPEQALAEAERQAQLDQLTREIAQLESQQQADVVMIARLEHEIERCRIRSPIDGRIGEAAHLHAGTVLDEGQWLATIVPTSTAVRVHAAFPAATAMGRIVPGQRARIRLDGFPWSQYGTISAIVEQVAGESRDGLLRVELAVTHNGDDDDDGDVLAGLVPLQHGLQGSVEVAVEQVSPAVLVLRAAGRRNVASVPVADARSGDANAITHMSKRIDG